MGVYGGPNVSESGLVFYYDFGNREKAFGTTNLIPNTGLGIYNNVPAHVTASLTQTSETYKGSPVWALTLTPTTATGVSYLTAGNNPGIGVYTGGGGGTGGVYTGHSIFYKPTVPMYSFPIYTGYSNIGGWQSNTNYDDMGDGWYRAHVVWYNATTLSDAKYWAINPASATLNVPITIYWAAPFKEAQNYTNFVSPYTLSTRGSGGGVVNLTNQEFPGGVFVNGPTYSSANGGSLVFDGVDDYVSVANSNSLNPPTNTLICWAKSNTSTWNQYGFLMSKRDVFIIHPNLSSTTVDYYYNLNNTYVSQQITVSDITIWNMYACSWDGTNINAYLNGALINSGAKTGPLNTSDTGVLEIGRDDGLGGRILNGNIAQVSIYNRALSAAEIQQNYNATKSRYGL